MTIYKEKIGLGTKKETLVFIHGNSSSSQVFDHYFEENTHYNLLRFDLPGHGRSAHFPKESYEYASVLEVCFNLIHKEVSDEDFILIGNSLGGHLAIELFARMDRCKGLVIFGTPPLEQPANLEEAFLPVEVLGNYFKSAVSDLELELTMQAASANRKVRELLSVDFRNTDPEFREQFFQSAVHKGQMKNQREIVETSTRPVFIIHGQNDASINFNYLKEIKGVSHIYEIEDGGHYVSIDKPKRFKEIVDEIASKVFAI